MQQRAGKYEILSGGGSGACPTYLRGSCLVQTPYFSSVGASFAYIFSLAFLRVLGQLRFWLRFNFGVI